MMTRKSGKERGEGKGNNAAHDEAPLTKIAIVRVR
jgi:hypothetical protein